MKPSKTLWILLLLCLLSAMPCFAHDTDLYMSSGEGVEPNILIIKVYAIVLHADMCMWMCADNNWDVIFFL